MISILLTIVAVSLFILACFLDVRQYKREQHILSELKEVKHAIDILQQYLPKPFVTSTPSGIAIGEHIPTNEPIYMNAARFSTLRRCYRCKAKHLLRDDLGLAEWKCSACEFIN